MSGPAAAAAESGRALAPTPPLYRLAHDRSSLQHAQHSCIIPCACVRFAGTWWSRSRRVVVLLPPNTRRLLLLVTAPPCSVRSRREQARAWLSASSARARAVNSNSSSAAFARGCHNTRVESADSRWRILTLLLIQGLRWADDQNECVSLENENCW